MQGISPLTHALNTFNLIRLPYPARNTRYSLQLIFSKTRQFKVFSKVSPAKDPPFCEPRDGGPHKKTGGYDHHLFFKSKPTICKKRGDHDKVVGIIPVDRNENPPTNQGRAG